MNAPISPTELKTLLTTGCCLVDVREPVEFAEEHIAGSRLIPLAQLDQRSGEIDCAQPLVVMCRSGKRGQLAAEKLVALGFKDVRNLHGGILQWKADGLPVAVGEQKVFPLMRQVQIVIGIGVLTGVAMSRLVHPDFIFLSAFFGAGLLFAGLSGWCGLALLLAKMPWNRVEGSTCQPKATCCTAR
ncbi:MAG: hypothetical protein JWL81_1631 [Verrucomicrobiales bacterium]|nr:hypothetical protein [Verrucomicrobiales bacterium]